MTGALSHVLATHISRNQSPSLVTYQKCTVLIPTGLFHILPNKPCAGGAAAAVASVACVLRPPNRCANELLANLALENRREPALDDIMLLLPPTLSRGTCGFQIGSYPGRFIENVVLKCRQILNQSKTGVIPHSPPTSPVQ